MKHASYLVRQPTPATSHGADCMQAIRELLANPKPPGNWWAKEVMAKVAAGKPVSIAAYELAKTALKFVPEREPGSDDEEI